MKIITVISKLKIEDEDLELFIGESMPIPFRNKIELLENGVTEFQDEEGSEVSVTISPSLS